MEAPIASERTRKETREMESRQGKRGQVERKRRTGKEVRAEEQRACSARYLAIAVPYDGIAPSSNGHGRQTFQELIDVLLQSEAIPATLCFYTGGVRWLTRESPLLNELQELCRRGAEIVACRACLREAGLLDSFVVGNLDTQDHIDDILRHAQHTMVV